MEDYPSPNCMLFSPRNNLVGVTDGMNEHQLQLLEDAIKIQRNKLSVMKLARYGVKAEYMMLDDTGTAVRNYYNNIVVTHKHKDTVTRIHPKQNQIQRFIDMLANLNEDEAVSRWIERSEFEDWQIEVLNREEYETMYEENPYYM